MTHPPGRQLSPPPEGLGATLTAASLTAASLQADWPTTTGGWGAFVITPVVAVGKAVTK